MDGTVARPEAEADSVARRSSWLAVTQRSNPILTTDSRARRPRSDRSILIARWRGWTGFLALVSVAYAFVYVGLFLARPGGEQGGRILSDFGGVPLDVIGGVLALAVVARDPRRRTRLAWSLFAMALAGDLTGNLLYGAYDMAGATPFPSLADAFYLAFYPCVLLGLLVLPTASARKELLSWRVWSNIAIVMVGGGMALVHFVLLPTIAQLSGDVLTTVVSLAYPLGDLALLTAIATVTARRPYAGDRPALTLFMVAVAAWFFGDVVFAIQSANGSYGAGSPADLMYLTGGLTFVLAAQASLARLPDTDRANPGEDATLGRFGPYAMLGIGLATLISAAVGDNSEITALAVLTALLTVLVVFRQLVDENQRREVEIRLREEHALAAERAARQALHDPLTGLPNRRRLHELLQAEIAASRLTGRPVTLAFLDLNYFKAINDNLGHAVGDEVLVVVARLLQQSARVSDTVTRLGGDEFAIVLPGTSAAHALEVVGRANVALGRPFVASGTEIAITGAFGLATFPDCGAADGADLMRRADTTMYRAKRGRQGPTPYDASYDEVGPDASAFAKLRTAIDNDGLILVYQPIRELLSGRTTAVEALVRWKHPGRGLLPPDEFLPLANQMGLMGALDARVLELACAQARAWCDVGLDICVNVNVSRDSIQDIRYPELLRMTLRRHGLPGRSIVLEVTENGLLESAEQARKVVESAAELGVRMAIDDFGTGFSSLGRLRDLPVDYLKIDQSFVIDALLETQSAAIVESVVNLAHRLGKQVVAEGVEDEATLAYLDRLAVDYAQGFFVGRPVPPDEISARLRAESARPVTGSRAPALEPLRS
ncbi:MAG: putative bifunctional diguanylate cyclase/phosphodiesterase [Candidatus Limnocylindrales bacterium]